MINQIFVNLLVKDLQKTMTFWKALGFEFNPQFTNEDAGCLVLGENIFAMLMVEKSWTGFTPGRKIVDTSKAIEVLNAIQVGSREEVDEIFEKVMANGGQEFRDTEDHGFMYNRPFVDIDGHIWEPFYMDMSKLPKQ